MINTKVFNELYSGAKNYSKSLREETSSDELVNKAWPQVKEYMDWYLDPLKNERMSEVAADQGVSFDEAIYYNLFQDKNSWRDPEFGIVETGWWEDDSLSDIFDQYEFMSPEQNKLIDKLVTKAKDYASQVLNSRQGQSTESLGKESITEAKFKSPQELEDFAMELESVKADYEDFGPDGFYSVPFKIFERDYPLFAREIIKTFLSEMGILTTSELNNIDDLGDEDGNYWDTGRLILPDDWDTLFDGAERLLTNRKDKGIQWEKIYKKYYRTYNESALTNIDDVCPHCGKNPCVCEGCQPDEPLRESLPREVPVPDNFDFETDEASEFFMDKFGKIPVDWDVVETDRWGQGLKFTNIKWDESINEATIEKDLADEELDTEELKNFVRNYLEEDVEVSTGWIELFYLCDSLYYAFNIKTTPDELRGVLKEIGYTPTKIGSEEVIIVSKDITPEDIEKDFSKLSEAFYADRPIKEIAKDVRSDFRSFINDEISKYGVGPMGSGTIQGIFRDAPILLYRVREEWVRKNK